MRLVYIVARGDAGHGLDSQDMIIIIIIIFVLRLAGPCIEARLPLCTSPPTLRGCLPPFV